MGKYSFMGFFLALILLVASTMMVNHATNTANMELIDTGVKTAVMGSMRAGEDYGMRARDVVALITKEVANNTTDNKKVAKVDFKFFTNENGTGAITYDNAISNNRIVKSVQYRVELYNVRDLDMSDVNNGNILTAEPKLKNNAQAESSTENRIVLGRTT